jgi:predicted Rossmann fold flavoprotein
MIYDVIIVGAGAAGLMTATTAAKRGGSVLLLEGQPQVGAKILMSGGTRCNVTNKVVSQKDFNSQQIIYVRNILRSFSNADTIRFFKDLGVELVVEPTGKYFPSTNSGKTILEAFLWKIHTQPNITLLCDHKVKAAGMEGDVFIVQGDRFNYSAKNLVLTTGGLSYPATGSDGIGYRLAQSFGHSMVETSPALVPFMSRDSDLKALSGISLPVCLTLVINGKRDISCRDSFLFTHFGFSGPVVLDISRHFLRSPRPKQILANFLPDHNENSLQIYLHNALTNTPRKTLRGLLVESMPQRLADVLLKKSGLEGHLPVNQLDKQARKRLMENCLKYPLDVTGASGYSKAEITAGGVDLAEINPKTLESKLVSGLFFAGEILDVDGRIGGFNFQWAWASGHVAGEALTKQKEAA